MEQMIFSTISNGNLNPSQKSVNILSLATSVPENIVPQATARDEAAPYLSGDERMLAVFAKTGVQTRHLIKPICWYHEPHDWVERTQVFSEAAFELLLDVTERCIAEAKVDPSEIDGIVLVTSTGITIPTLDVRVASHFGLPVDVQRTPLFGLGCAGGATGLARAIQMAQSDDGATILFLAVELCSANLSLLNVTRTDAVGFALFGDGAVGMILQGNDSSKAAGNSSIARSVGSGEYMWPDTERLAGITVRNDSLGLELSLSLVSFLQENFGSAAQAFLSRYSLCMEDLAGVVLHAGASQMINAAADSFGIEDDWVESSRVVLRDFGNLSACSVLFVLDHTIRSGATGRHLMAAFGPGFTVSFLLLDLGSSD